MTSEREFIDGLRQRFPARPPVLVGIGDDGAVIDSRQTDQQIVVTDMLLDGTHFDLRSTDPWLVGRKAMAVNLSDLAAMGCRPTAAFVSLAMPRMAEGAGEQFLRRLYDGMCSLTDQFHFTVAGGDTNSWSGPFAINVCLTGIPLGHRPWLRSDAKPGDRIFVTGPLGGSLLSQRHLTFTPRLAEAEWLAKHVPVRAMMDISDGLSLDLHRIVAASGVAAVIDEYSIPIHADVSHNLSAHDRLSAALNDGEDFELLFTVGLTEALRLMEVRDQLPVPLWMIGEIVPGTGCQLRTCGGQRHDLAADGWQHQL